MSLAAEQAIEQTVAKILYVYNQKGGSGKTTTTMNLAAGLHEQGYRVLVVDIDPQNSVAKWFSNGDGSIPYPYTNLARAGHTIANELEKQIDNYDFIVIDGRPQVELKTSKLLLVSDLVIIPMRLTTMDFDATADLLTEIRTAQLDNPDLRYAYLFNQVVDEERVLAKTCIAIIEQEGHKTFDTRIRSRECHPNAYERGQTVYQRRDSSSQHAAGEVTALSNEVLAMFPDVVKPQSKTKAGRRATASR
ncbi:ParA family protein [Paraburkholderia sp. J8-2]|uniref:ParA family protein n=1 Tax=Paraburkholderia sp. J8-2 TaxID=2805440 RepID=UPI002AB6BABB|nr:ParA family protein [Paraburkholderia sp. J8-2]